MWGKKMGERQESEFDGREGDAFHRDVDPGDREQVCVREHSPGVRLAAGAETPANRCLTRSGLQTRSANMPYTSIEPDIENKIPTSASMAGGKNCTAASKAAVPVVAAKTVFSLN